MIWLASFPRSGNTFFRNLLYEVYGIESSTYHQDENRTLDPDFLSYPVVKTHLRPFQLPAPGDKSVYIVRDGRDSLVSLAHHRKDIVEPGTDFYNNLLEAILSPGGSNFGGWVANVQSWLEKADLVIHFEELIRDPVRQAERLRAIMDLPTPNPEKVPSFQDLKFGDPQYGAGEPHQKHLDLGKHHFRKGKAGSWQEEMPPELEELFWLQAGTLMQSLGYDRESGFTGEKIENPLSPSEVPCKILIETTKLSQGGRDGVQRYLEELLGHLPELVRHYPGLEIDTFNHGYIQSLPVLPPVLELVEKDVATPEAEVVTEKRQRVEGGFSYEKILLGMKSGIRAVMPGFIYTPLAKFYRQGPWRKLLRYIRFWRIRNMLGDIRRSSPELLASYDLIHVPLPQNMHWLEELEKPFLVTVHDLTHRLFPDYHTRENIELAESGMQSALERKASFIAISEASSRDLQREYGVPADRIRVIYEGANRGRFNRQARATDLAALRMKYELPAGPYFLCLSTIEPRKNLGNMVRAFLQFLESHPDSPYHLFICGRKGWKTEELFAEIGGEHPRVRFTGFVDEEDLAPLYAHARALCYVSQYEGFGLPLLEAMSCGTPVIYGNNSSMPEVAGEGGLPAAADEVESISRALEKMANDEAVWKENQEAAWRQSNRFSWWKAAFETVQLYRSIGKEDS